MMGAQKDAPQSDSGHGEESHDTHAGGDNNDTQATNKDKVTDVDQNSKGKSDGEEWMDVLGNGLLRKKVLSDGDGEKPSPMQYVTIKTSGQLSDGTVIDVNDSISFTLGGGDVINAWELTVTLMQCGETAEVITDAKYAYGSLGREPDIPKDAHITYRIELLKIEPAIDYLSMKASELVKHCDKKRERGNYLYSRGEYSQAINSYMQALKILDDEGRTYDEDAEELQKLIDMRVKCYNNLAAAQLKSDAWDAAMASCESVLRLQPENVKALFRKGKCLAGKGDTESAIVFYKRALKLEPQTKIIHQELSRLTTLQKAQDKSQRAMYQRMLGGKHKPKRKDKSLKWLYIGSAVAAVLVSVGIAAYRFVTP